MMARKLFVCFCFDRCKAQEGVWRAECAAAAVRPRRRRLHRVVHQQGLRHRQVLRRRHRLHLPQAVPGSGLSPRRQRHENGLIFTENFSHQAFSYVGGIHAYTIIPSYTKEIHLYGAL